MSTLKENTNHEDYWERLKKSYLKKGLVLAFGTGISRGCDIPTWDSLLRKLSKITFPTGTGETLYELLKKDGYTFPAIASIIETQNRDLFAKALKEQLYEDFKHKGGFKRGTNEEPRLKKEFVRYVWENNKTLAAVAGLCVTTDHEAGYLPNPRIRAIVNFNYDSIFRSYVRYRYGKKLIRSIERPSAGSIYGRIPVYYMHGFIRFDRDNNHYDSDENDLQHNAPDLRILTEQEYFDFYSNPNGMFTYTFLYLLRESPCLFIGLSMKDDNIRRLLHYSKIEREKGYIQEGRSEEAEEESIRHYAMLQKPGNETLAELTEKSLLRLGVMVLWLESFDEIPERLGGIYDGNDFKWHDIFKYP